jgi:hypothetical protein
MPDHESRAAVVRRIKADIREHGQSIVYVGADPESGADGFAYTVGRAKRGLPELLMTAMLRPETAMSLLNHLDREMPETRPHGSLVYLGGEFPVMLLDATDPRTFEDFAVIARQLYPNCAVQQVLLCDPVGKFPPDASRPFDRQTLLGQPPTQH